MELLAVISTFLLSLLRTAAPPADVSASVGPLLDLGATYTEFRSSIFDDTQLRYVPNSGVCETTPDVNQYSGYLDIGPNKSMVCYNVSYTFSLELIVWIHGQWFWFFEAGHNPETAPFTLW